jgi:hypothetical protein
MGALFIVNAWIAISIVIIGALATWACRIEISACQIEVGAPRN